MNAVTFDRKLQTVKVERPGELTWEFKGVPPWVFDDLERGEAIPSRLLETFEPDR